MRSDYRIKNLLQIQRTQYIGTPIIGGDIVLTLQSVIKT